MGLELSFRKHLQFETHFWSLIHLVPEIGLFEEKKFFPYILALRGNIGTIRKVGVFDQFSVPRPNWKLFDHEKWFLTYLTYI